MKATTPNGFSTIARALIDPGSSTSLVHERIAQHLRLPPSKKNVMGEAVVGITTPTQGSVWFQVSGVEDDAEKIGVEAYGIRKVSKNVPLQWRNTSETKEFRPAVCWRLSPLNYTYLIFPVNVANGTCM